MNVRLRCPTLLWVLVLASVCGLAIAQGSVPEVEIVPGEAGEGHGALEVIRLALVELRFEEAVEEATELVERADLSEAVRVEALSLRSQAHVALGHWEELERDYAAILEHHPAFAPDPAITPRKARERFDKIRAVAVGTVRIAVHPEDAEVTVGGRPVERDAAGLVVLPVGSQTLELQRPGYDLAAHTVVVEPANTVEVAIQLVPNARSVLVLTEPEGVEIALDGRAVGTTRRASPGEPASLLLELLPLEEHVFTLTKACHGTELRRELLAADLTDNSPWTLGPVELRKVYARLAVTGEPASATVVLDGQEIGVLPLEHEACPGPHTLQVLAGDRRLWSADVNLASEVTTSLNVAPRPNLVLAGAEVWPTWLERFGAAFNVIERDARLPADPTVARDWSAAGLPADTDLVLAPRRGERERWLAHSPWLGQVVELDPSRVDLARPAQEIGSWGVRTADSVLGGPALVVEVTPKGAAAALGIAPGDRITALGGAPVGRAEQVRGILRAASPARLLAVAWATKSGEVREGSLAAATSLLIEPSRGNLLEDMNRTAWASADAELGGERGHRARAVLALLADAWGRPDRAVEVWSRVELPERPGIGRGMVRYYLGRSLEILGRTEEAVAAYRSAASSAGRLFHDEGPPVAPAARDRLAGLGDP